MQNSILALVTLFSVLLLAASPGDKRTILTSGERVHTIHYELGQSTVLYFGMKPDTVICGNKNYFNIEKIKEGLTVQPLSNFSTNLTVLTQGRRFLFYLTPARGGPVDSFIDVRWIPESDSRILAAFGAGSKEVTQELNQKIHLGSPDVTVKREIQIENSKRSIVEFEVKNIGSENIKTSTLEVLAFKAGRPLDHQVSVFEQEEIKPNKFTTGRLIVSGNDLKGTFFVMNYQGKSGQIQLPGGRH